jgi:hypothetical protein
MAAIHEARVPRHQKSTPGVAAVTTQTEAQSIKTGTGSAIDSEPLKGCQSIGCCSDGLYNKGWDGYRLGDMLQSRYQRHTASGAVYHMKSFPQSLVAQFLKHYKAPSRKSRAASDGFEAVTGASCHPHGNISLFPLNARTCGDANVPLHLQCCPYILPVPAILHMLSREHDMHMLSRERERVPFAPRVAAIHIRAGEVIDLSPCRVDQMLSTYTRFERSCRRGKSVWTGTACMGQPAMEFVMPLPHFELVRLALEARSIRNVVIVAGSALNLIDGFTKSCNYLQRVGDFFSQAGFQVAFRLGYPPDDDLRFFTRVATFFPAGGSYARYAGEVAAALGVEVLYPSNRSKPLPILRVRHKRREYVKYVC